MRTIADKVRAAGEATGDKLWLAIKSQHPDVLATAILNANLTEDMALYIANCRRANPEDLGFLAGDVRFKDVYRIKLALCQNPKVPMRVTLSLLKFLRIFDLADITRNKLLPMALRQKVEFSIMERIPTMPSGIRKALSRRVCATLVIKLMLRSEQAVISDCLESPMITEDHLRELVTRRQTKQQIIGAIAAHPRWSLRYSLRYSLVRNFFTPMEHVERFIGGLKTMDLQEIYGDTSVTNSTKPFILRELRKRGEPLEQAEEEIYELDENLDDDLDGLLPDDE